jgi:general secretion pathway protein J
MTAEGYPGRSPAADREAGFTLVELLVSLVLLVLVVGLLSGALQFARGTWDAAAKLDHRAGYETAESFLRARLSEVTPVYEPAMAGTVRVAFSGTSDTLTFVAPAPNGPAGAGLYRYTVGVSTAADQKVLVVGLSSFAAKSGGSDSGTARVDHVLLGNVTSFRVRYFGRNDQGVQPAWVDAWTRTDAIPDLVELVVGHGEGTFNVAVELQLRPRRL